MLNKIFLLITTYLITETQHDAPMVALSIFMAALAGFAIRLGIDWQNNQITLKRIAIQILYIGGLCWAGLNFWSYLDLNFPVTTYVFFVSLFSIFIVGLLDKIGKVGLSVYFKNLLKNLLADDELKNKDHDN